VRGQAMDSAATRRIRLPRVGSDLHAPVVGEGRAGSRLPPLAEAAAPFGCRGRRSPRLQLRRSPRWRKEEWRRMREGEGAAADEGERRGGSRMRPGWGGGSGEAGLGLGERCVDFR
jgi:hypothetical protein